MKLEGKILKRIQGVDIYLCPDGVIRFIGDFCIDSDGGPNVDHDPCWQPDTTLHHNGRPINAQTVPYVVIPQGILDKVGPIGLGCQCFATYRNKKVGAVLADLGPFTKQGEGSPELARRLGINPNSRTGGLEEEVVLYEIFIGVPAIVDGVAYKLQPLHGPRS